jgi:hypothetical protein
MAERKRRDAPAEDKRVLVAIKVRPSELARIDDAAGALGLTRTDFMIRKCLGEPVGDESFGERIDWLERRLERLEALLAVDRIAKRPHDGGRFVADDAAVP